MQSYDSSYNSPLSIPSPVSDESNDKLQILAVIDMKLRYRIVHMALDIEHHTKLQLLRMMDKFNEDGYQIVQDYLDSLSEVQRKICDSEINRNNGRK